MKNYKSPKAKTVPGRKFGLPFVDCLSTLSVESAQPIAWHTHDETEVLICLKGSLSYEFRAHMAITLPEGHFLVIPRGLEHRLAYGIDGPCRRCSVFLKAASRALPNTPLKRDEYRDLLADLLKKRMRPRAFPARIHADLLRLADLTSTADPLSSREKVELRIISLSTLLALATTKRPAPQKTEVKLMKEATDWLGRHYAEHVSIDSLVAFMGYGRSRFFTLFKRHTGLSPTEWLIRFRIKKAIELLESGANVSTTARLCGFADPSFFARIFRKRTGHTPALYRKGHVKTARN